MSISNSKYTIVHWFRKGLRVHDNPALVNAIEEVNKNPHLFYLRPIFILDPELTKWLRIGPNRWRFLQQSLQQLDANLRKLNSRLYVVRGDPIKVFERVFKDWNVKQLTFETDIEPYARERDEKVLDIAKTFDIDVVEISSHTLYNQHDILRDIVGNVPLTYQKFLSVVDRYKVPKPLEVPDMVADSSAPCADNEEKKSKKAYDLPTLAELGVKERNLGVCKYPGGEIEALSRLERYMARTTWVCNFEKPNTAPNSLEPSTTVLSPYIKFGCLSSRLFYKRLEAVTKDKTHSQPPVSLLGQLLWREYYYVAAAGTKNFDKIEGNVLCKQISWDTNKEFLEAWSYGKTGYPFIDAIMRQLRQEGWIHHLARHAVACFLTRGDLYLSWEEGQKVFEELLLDADWALNAGNWLWLSASAFFHQFYRVYSPVAFGKKTDKNGDYIRKYCPELKKFSTDYIYEPWKASPQIQAKVGCIVGKDYPQRIIIHEEVYKINIERMSAAYKDLSLDKSLKRKMPAIAPPPKKGKALVKSLRFEVNRCD